MFYVFCISMKSERILAGDFFAYMLVFVPVYVVTGLIVILIFFSLGELCTFMFFASIIVMLLTGYFWNKMKKSKN